MTLETEHNTERVTPRTCILTGAEGENPDDCTTHEHEDADTAASNTAVCRYCNEIIMFDGIGAWLDATDGDCCSGDDNLVNENQSHEPGGLISDSQYPQHNDGCQDGAP